MIGQFILKLFCPGLQYVCKSVNLSFLKLGIICNFSYFQTESESPVSILSNKNTAPRQLRTFDSGSGSDPLASLVKNGGSKRNALLKWCQAQTSGYVEVNSIFCILLIELFQGSALYFTKCNELTNLVHVIIHLCIVFKNKRFGDFSYVRVNLLDTVEYQQTCRRNLQDGSIINKKHLPENLLLSKDLLFAVWQSPHSKCGLLSFLLQFCHCKPKNIVLFRST